MVRYKFNPDYRMKYNEGAQTHHNAAISTKAFRKHVKVQNMILDFLELESFTKEDVRRRMDRDITDDVQFFPRCWSDWTRNGLLMIA